MSAAVVIAVAVVVTVVVWEEIRTGVVDVLLTARALPSCLRPVSLLRRRCDFKSQLIL